MDKRISREKLYIGIASLFSLRGTCGRLQVGCTIVKDGRTICSGYNGPPKVLDHTKTKDRDICNCNKDNPCERALHAEANAISFAAKHGISLDGSAIYCTHSPCLKCAELILSSGIYLVVYKEAFRDDAGILFLKDHNIIVKQYDESE